MDLKTYFKKYPDYFVSGLNYGYMDMTYFSFLPGSLKNRKLKVAIVFIHETLDLKFGFQGKIKIFKQSN